MIKNIILDLGGVYFTNGMIIFYDKYMSKLGVSKEKYIEVFSGPLGIKYRLGKINEKKFWFKALKKLNLDINIKEYAEKWHSSYVRVLGIKGLIGDLRKKGFLVVGLSNNIKERIEYLDKKYSFRKDFDHLFLSNEVGLLKPDIKFYKHMLNELNLKPEECVLFDDKRGNLVEPKKLGMKVVLFKDVKHLRDTLNKISKK